MDDKQKKDDANKLPDEEMSNFTGGDNSLAESVIIRPTDPLSDDTKNNV